ncbi:MAG: aspartate aminotransferase family protein [Bacteroidetes bacterium]|nr:MAG: aspartate aminotransferase family protein [Bacteroidota bacterium]
MSWKKLNHDEIKEIVFSSLKGNISYSEKNLLGVPASYLDEKVFPKDNALLKDAPFLSTMVENPNHIGCHTFGSSESFFSGTHKIEQELIEICAVDIFKSKENSIDGYVASGGTEANIEAIWIYRNYFMYEFNAKPEEILLVCSADSHYSMAKAANLLNIPLLKAEVDQFSRKIDSEQLKKSLVDKKENGTKYIIAVANMMTTMFGSVDDPSDYTDIFKALDLPFKLHIDGAYGGFYYPFSNKESNLNFDNSDITSITIDAHKMAQAPYGTGIFLIRKDWMKYAQTKEASYVEGEDCTLIGSRSGANAVSVWMILSKYGPYGWMEKIFVLQKRTDWLCEQLRSRDIVFFRDKHSNIVTIDSKSVDHKIAEHYHLVPDNHNDPKWFKIVVMDHVSIDKLMEFLTAIDEKRD